MRAFLPFRKTMPSSGLVALALASFIAAGSAHAGRFGLRVGPPSVGRGGSNPLSIPPVRPIEYELTHVTDGGFESNLSQVPGLFFGLRSPANESGGYVSLGGGLAIGGNGNGPGFYSAFGWEGDGAFRFNIEYKQALAYDFGEERVISPYAIRLGMIYHY